MSVLPVRLVGADQAVPCVDGSERPYLSLDGAASTSALPGVVDRVNEFLPWYSSVHRGAGYKSQISTAAYEEARAAALDFAGRGNRDDVAIICRNTTEAINHLAYRLRLEPDATVVMTVAEHHANLLPWTRLEVRRSFVEGGAGVLIGPRTAFVDGDPFLAGGGAVDLVDLDEVIWTDPPDREEAGSPNVIGAVALGAAISELRSLGWDAIVAHEQELAERLRSGLAATPGVRLLGPALDVPTLAVAAFEIEDVPHALVAARLSAEFGIGVRHG